MTDWRVDSAEHLRGLTLRREKYTRWSESWDHDHCSACWAKFAETGDPNVLHEGFATCEDYKHGAKYNWVCPECFSELRVEMGWTEAK